MDRVERLVLKDRVKDLILVVSPERRLAQEHLVDEYPKRPPVDGPAVALLEDDLPGSALLSAHRSDALRGP